MIKNTRMVICQSIVTDKETNLVSYLNCLEEVRAIKFPIRLASISLGMLWDKTSKKEITLKVRVNIENPSGIQKQLGEIKNVIKKTRHRLHVVMDGLAIEQEGIYKFFVEYFEGGKWKKTDFVPLEVIKIKKPITTNSAEQK